MSPTSSGSKYSPASPPVSGSAVARAASDRHAARHRLDEHEPEALVQRRVHERVGAAHERVQARVGEVAGQPHGLAAGRLAHALGLRAAVDAGEHEPVLQALLAQPRERLDEPQQVLLRAQVADGEQVRARRRAPARRRSAATARWG